jgi:hypothetical protein
MVNGLHALCRIVVASVSGGSGSTYIGGLPFTTVNSSIAQGTLQVGTSIGFVTKSPEMGGHFKIR